MGPAREEGRQCVSFGLCRARIELISGSAASGIKTLTCIAFSSL
jgi:hypothetical protein